MITLYELKNHLSYCKESGIFKWIEPTSPFIKKGEVAGTVRNDGRRVIFLFKKKYFASRLAFLYVNGRWPNGMIDHINGNPSDDRYINIRECCGSENQQNQAKRKDNTSGIKGVSFDSRSGKWKVQISIHKKQKTIGVFKDLEFAELVSIEARNKFHGRFACHGNR